ncbi:MAG: hypothetical protein ACKOXF_00295 [Chitinophagaceae bacterium]
MILSGIKFSSILLVLTGLLSFTNIAQNTVTINIQTPFENSSVKMGDTVFIKASISSDASLHDVSVKVKTADNTITAFTENIHTHDNKITINKNYIQTIKYKTELILEISCRDHSGNIIASSSRKFYSDKK